MFEATTEAAELRKGLADWAKDLSEGHIEADEAGEFPWHKWRMIQRSGLLGLPFAQPWGGLERSLPEVLHVLEGLGEYCRDSGLSFCATTTMASTGVPVERFGTAEQQKRYLPGICSGELIGAHAITESESGSDALRMATRAEPDGDGFVLHGSKLFVTNAPIADVFVVYARTHPDGGPLGTTAFLVDRDTPGLTCGAPARKMGLRTAPMSELSLDGVRVARDRVVGRVGGGFLVMDHVMKREILFTAAVHAGEMEHRLQRCLDYAKSRHAFGRPIGSYQSVTNRIAEMRIRLDTARKWIFDTGERLAAGHDVTVDLAATKLVTSEANVAGSLAAVAIFGGHGYMVEQGMEKEVRNAVGGTVYSGTSDIHYNRIAAALGLDP
ncbi:acyl-CoA dehydrogenase family protein [Streptomonospora litoralis]|uniref:Acyl-CoA dehydrogenase n=1 Tax=Streptomonospora litoralis TaxID=2498135 RepID=A0A4P6Q756_9ACTN|nr:acyl-CoA dehydrogenase family protein [Streptomonospora litoralis]QBI54929.1 Acyl-CoA dehydrogenase [Streptomonospora litoralis]